MIYLKNFLYTPGGEHESGATPIRNDDDKKSVSPSPLEPDENKEDTPIIDKIKEALQEWSNKDEADQEFDDTRV